MRFLALSVLGCLLVALASGKQNWFNLRTTWSATTIGGFQQQPRTVEEAESEGWIKISDGCNEESKWPGARYVPAEDDLSMVLIYDVNGFIAGMQSVVPEDLTLHDVYYDFTKVPMYNLDELNVNGNVLTAFLTTAYFVSPEIICNGGRTQDEFDAEGTGRDLILQNGPTYEEKDLMQIPLNQADMAYATEWYEHSCFFNMGNHFFQFSYDQDQSCRDGFPVQILYDHQGEQELIGFVWQHVGFLEGPRWETVNRLAIDSIIVDPPTCLYELANEPGVRTMHVYLRDYIETCLF